MAENPSAFPFQSSDGDDMNTPEYGMTMRDWFATFAPQPSDEAIKSQHDQDFYRNPHNEPYHNKPPRRSRERIIADLRYAFADAMLDAREKPHTQGPSL
jgi:hypothetical protein